MVSFIGGGNGSTRENCRHATSHRQTLSHDVVSCTPRHDLGKLVMNIAEIVTDDAKHRDESSQE